MPCHAGLGTPLDFVGFAGQCNEVAAGLFAINGLGGLLDKLPALDQVTGSVLGARRV